MTHVVFNPPPGWPPSPPGWLPPIGWEVPSDWPEPPEDWVLYLESPSSQHARIERKMEKAEDEAATWWLDGPGYHSAYYVEPPLESKRRWGLDSWPTIKRPQSVNSDNSAGKRGRRKWFRRSLLAAATIGFLLFAIPLLTSPVSRAIAACETAISEEALKLAAASTSGVPDPSLAARYSRSEMRYTVAESGSTSLVTIVGNYLAPGGEWYTFSCTARHDVSPSQVLDATLTPVVPTQDSLDGQDSR